MTSCMGVLCLKLGMNLLEMNLLEMNLLEMNAE
jgi:hypothetical protein